MNRKELAKELCIGSETLRYYERLGIIDKPRRSGNNYRDYSERDVKRLMFIKTAKEYGFTLKEIKEYLGRAEVCEGWREELGERITGKIADIEKEIERLGKMRELLLLFESANYSCECLDLVK